MSNKKRKMTRSGALNSLNDEEIDENNQSQIVVSPFQNHQNKEKNLTKLKKKALTENNNLIQQREAAARELEAVQTQDNQTIISSFVSSSTQ
jgi:hypothetical protein